MGICNSCKKLKNNGRIVNEVEIDDSEINEIDNNVYKVIPSVCKIKIQNKNGMDFLLNYIKMIKNYFA